MPTIETEDEYRDWLTGILEAGVKEGNLELAASAILSEVAVQLFGVKKELDAVRKGKMNYPVGKIIQ